MKLEKCEFMQEEIEYLGFQVGWRWWRPVKEKVAPILRACIRDDETRGVKDIRAFLDPVIFTGGTSPLSSTVATFSRT